MSARAITFIMDVGLIVTWSSGFVGGKLASATDTIFLVLFWRFVITGLVLLPFTLKEVSQLSARTIIQQMLIGSLAMFGYLAGVNAAIHLGVPAALAALIAALQPLATAALAGPVLHKKVGKLEWLGLFIGFIGVAVSVAGNINQASATGFAMAFLGMLSLVAATLLTKHARNNPPIGSSLTIQSCTTAILFAPLALYMDNALIFPLDTAFWEAVIWFVLFSTLAAYGFYWGCLQRGSAVKVASLIYLTPPVTAVWALVMFDEAIATATMIGFAISLVGILIAQSNRARSSAHPSSAQKSSSQGSSPQQ